MERRFDQKLEAIKLLQLAPKQLDSCQLQDYDISRYSIFIIIRGLLCSDEFPQ